MKHPSSPRLRLAASVGAVLLGMLVAAGSALAVTAPGTPATDSPRNEPTWVFTWADADAEGEEVIQDYVGGPTVGPDEAPTTVVVSGAPIAVPETARYFRVAARLSDGVTVGPYSTLAIEPDYTPPTLSTAFTGTQGVDDWYRELVVQLTCADGPLPATCPSMTWGEDGEFGDGDRSASASDAAGNTTVVGLPAFKFDGTDPNPQPTVPGETTIPGEPLTPGTNALVAEVPTFTWTRGMDATSGVQRYELQYKRRTEGDAGYETIATVQQPPVGDPLVKPSAALPERVALDWRVVTYDRAGNFSASDPQGLTIDSTTPPAPTITGGPAQPTRNARPTFSWTGTENLFFWDVTAPGSQQPISIGAGPARQATPPSALPDGDYTFRVWQVTDAGRKSAEATRSFKVDTVAPGPPQILTRPTFPSITAPVFTWRTEPGAFSRWVLLNGVGTPIAGPTDSPAASAKLAENLPHGNYTFQFWQIDAAGNVSPPTVEPFTVLAPLVTPPPPSGTAALIAIMPRQYAKRLSPKAGKVLPTRSPVLRWKRGPRGTRLYNLQVFRVTKVRGRKTPKVKKVLSRFPKARQYRAPRKILRPNTCYVWRVWPYTGRAFTPKPVGVSNFCIAKAKVVKRAEAKALARKRALARKKAAARRKAATLRRAGAVKR